MRAVSSTTWRGVTEGSTVTRESRSSRTSVTGRRAQLQRVLQALLLLGVEQPGLAGVLDQPVELLAGEDRLDLVLGLDAEEPQDEPGAGAERRW